MCGTPRRSPSVVSGSLKSMKTKYLSGFLSIFEATSAEYSMNFLPSISASSSAVSLTTVDFPIPGGPRMSTEASG